MSFFVQAGYVLVLMPVGISGDCEEQRYSDDVPRNIKATKRFSAERGISDSSSGIQILVIYDLQRCT